MTLRIEQSLMTAPIWIPIREGWVETDVDVDIREGLTTDDISTGDVALIPGPIAPGLGSTHFIDPSVAIVVAQVSPIAMRTSVRPDGVEETPIRLLGTGATAEVLLRALLRPYFGITASTFVTSDDDPAAADAQVVVVDGILGLMEPEAGFQEDLAKAWFVMTGAAIVHAVTVVGVEAEARGAGAELELLKEAARIGVERRRDVRGIIAGDEEIDREKLAAITNGIRFEMTADDRQSLRNLLSRGTWDTRYGRKLPAFRDEVEAAGS